MAFFIEDSNHNGKRPVTSPRPTRRNEEAQVQLPPHDRPPAHGGRGPAADGAQHRGHFADPILPAAAGPEQDPRHAPVLVLRPAQVCRHHGAAARARLHHPAVLEREAGRDGVQDVVRVRVRLALHRRPAAGPFPFFPSVQPAKTLTHQKAKSRSVSRASPSRWEPATCRTWWRTSRSPSARGAWTCTGCTLRWRSTARTSARCSRVSSTVRRPRPWSCCASSRARSSSREGRPCRTCSRGGTGCGPRCCGTSSASPATRPRCSKRGRRQQRTTTSRARRNAASPPG